MIALYKMAKPLEQKISLLLKEFDIQPSYFYSLNAILDQMMKPLLVITPVIYMKELEPLSIPVLPLMVHLSDVENQIAQLNAIEQEVNETIVVASNEELRLLKLELNLKDQKEPGVKTSYIFLSKEQFLEEHEISRKNKCLMPLWTKVTELVRDLEKNIYYIEPSLTVLCSVIHHAISLLSYTEEKLREKFLVEAIVDSSHDGVVAVDKRGYITLANDNGKAMLGFEGEEMVGRKITDFIPHSDMIRILETGKTEQGDLALLHDKKALVNRFPVIVNNKIVGAVSNFKYITNIQRTELKLRKMLHHSGLEAKYSLNNIIGVSEGITLAKEQATVFVETDATVLITGESGTGKELFAQGIHLQSSRSQGPFVAINCAALPESLLESELFGYEEGAFTGARKGGKPGLFELAHGGTLFLDEIGEMPPRIQALLLRVLQEKMVRRIGGEKSIPIDVRILAATNRELEDEMEEGRFRADLYYRINVLSFELPPLRDRLEDIPYIVQSMVNQFNEQREKKIEKIDDEVYTCLMDYHWPGNVRELRNAVERMVLLEKGLILSNKHLTFSKKIRKGPQSIEKGEALNLKKVEKETICMALEKYQNNRKMAAQSLGMDRTTLWRKIKEYNL